MKFLILNLFFDYYSNKLSKALKDKNFLKVERYLDKKKYLINKMKKLKL